MNTLFYFKNMLFQNNFPKFKLSCADFLIQKKL